MITLMATDTGTTMIRYRGELAAFAGRRRIHFVGALEHLAEDAPDRKFVHAMGTYAAAVAAGELPGPYTDENAELFARTLLIPDEDLVLATDAPTLADKVGVPLEQAVAAIAARPVCGVHDDSGGGATCQKPAGHFGPHVERRDGQLWAEWFTEKCGDRAAAGTICDREPGHDGRHGRPVGDDWQIVWWDR